MLEPILYAILGVFIGGTLCYVIFTTLSNKNPRIKQMKETETFWYEECQKLRKEIRRLKSTVTNAKQGTIPYEAAEAGASDDQMVDSIFQVLPPNLKPILAPFKQQAKDMLKANPEIKENIINAIKQKAGAAAGKDESESQEESLG